MKFILHGACNEVGRSCVEVQTKKNNILFDAGIKLGGDVSEYPEKFDVSRINAVFLSHAHLDHSGALPQFNFDGLNCPIYCNNMTKALSKILMKDSLHIELIQNLSPAYNKENIYNVMDLMVNTPYNKEMTDRDMRFINYNAGHIPGSASTLVKVDGKKILYTGDFHTSETHLMPSANIRCKDVDVMICEATYGDRKHPSRKKEEETMIDKVYNTLNNDGSVIVPAFAVGRSQEMMFVLEKLKYKVPIYVDGMAKKVLKLFLQRPQFVKDARHLHKLFKKVNLVKGYRYRQEIIKTQGIFLTTSGMLDGGPVVDYIKHLGFNPHNSILLTGYQGEGTNGRLLLEEGYVYVDGNKMKVQSNYKKFDFSAHAGLAGLQSTIKKVNPKTLILNHGDPSSIKHLGKWAESEGFDVRYPELGEVINV